MIPVSCGEIADAVNGELVGVDPSAVVDGAVVIDSRAAGPGGLFVALPGENVDGHDYVGTATAAGVTVSLTARPVEGSPCIVVADPQAALGALARLVVADPHTLVLDEATSLIDPRTARHLEGSMAALLQDRTVVAIAHRLHTAHDADRIAVVIDGRIAELGSHHELVEADGEYARLWRAWTS